MSKGRNAYVAVLVYQDFRGAVVVYAGRPGEGKEDVRRVASGRLGETLGEDPDSLAGRLSLLSLSGARRAYPEAMREYEASERYLRRLAGGET